jgi:hypothetical protein
LERVAPAAPIRRSANGFEEILLQKPVRPLNVPFGLAASAKEIRKVPGSAGVSPASFVRAPIPHGALPATGTRRREAGAPRTPRPPVLQRRPLRQPVAPPNYQNASHQPLAEEHSPEQFDRKTGNAHQPRHPPGPDRRGSRGRRQNRRRQAPAFGPGRCLDVAFGIHQPWKITRWPPRESGFPRARSSFPSGVLSYRRR